MPKRCRCQRYEGRIPVVAADGTERWVCWSCYFREGWNVEKEPPVQRRRVPTRNVQGRTVIAEITARSR